MFPVSYIACFISNCGSILPSNTRIKLSLIVKWWGTWKVSFIIFWCCWQDSTMSMKFDPLLLCLGHTISSVLSFSCDISYFYFDLFGFDSTIMLSSSLIGVWVFGKTKSQSGVIKAYECLRASRFLKLIFFSEVVALVVVSTKPIFSSFLQ